MQLALKKGRLTSQWSGRFRAARLSAAHRRVRAHHPMHIGAAVSFLLAFFFYYFAWSNIAYGLAIFGVVFEIAAWAIWVAKDKIEEIQ